MKKKWQHQAVRRALRIRKTDSGDFQLIFSHRIVLAETRVTKLIDQGVIWPMIRNALIGAIDEKGREIEMILSADAKKLIQQQKETLDG